MNKEKLHNAFFPQKIKKLTHSIMFLGSYQPFEFVPRNPTMPQEADKTGVT